jgi:hypothetical protein
VVLEDPEEPVEPDVDARRLHHGGLEGVQRDPLGVDLGEDVAVGEQHTRNLPGPIRLRSVRAPHLPDRGHATAPGRMAA